MRLSLAKELKKNFPDLVGNYTVDEISKFYSKWSETTYCAGWMEPCRGYVQRAIEFYESDTSLYYQKQITLSPEQINDIVKNIVKGVVDALHKKRR